MIRLTDEPTADALQSTDEEMRANLDGPATASAASAGVSPAPDSAAVPGRLRWRSVASMETLAVAAVVGMLLLTTRFTPDYTLQTGDCVTVSADQPPIEVACAGQHDAVVERRIPFDRSCPAATVPYRDRTGRVCVVPVPALGGAIWADFVSAAESDSAQMLGAPLR